MTMLDMLYMLVTSTIYIAQHGPKGTEKEQRAWRVTSKIEEEIAFIIPITDAEGRIARRGAVLAALASGNRERAQRLSKKYRNETTTDSRFRHELEILIR